MKKIVFQILMISLIAIFAQATTAMAEESGVTPHRCWNISPYIDNLELAVTNEGGGIFALHGVWRASGVYNLACHGTIVNDTVSGNRDFALSCQDKYDDPRFYECLIHAKLLPDLTGPLILHIESDGFQNTGTLAPIPCPIPLSVKESGPTLMGK